MYSFEKIVIFITIFHLYTVVTCEDLNEDSIDRDVRDRGNMWFGPRLGKRSLRLANENDRQTLYRMLEAADALKFYYDQLPYYDAQAEEPEARVTKKVIFTPKLGRSLNKLYEEKRRDVDFTPRLGRRLSDEVMVTPADQEVYRPDPEQSDSRSKYFSPRLGRTMKFSPRLGRELAYDVYPDKIRVARSTNKTKST